MARHSADEWKAEVWLEDGEEMGFIISTVNVDANDDTGRVQDYGISILEGYVPPGRNHEEARANIRLATAAPRLLRALQKQLASNGHTLTCILKRRSYGDSYCINACAEAREAILEATEDRAALAGTMPEGEA